MPLSYLYSLAHRSGFKWVVLTIVSLLGIRLDAGIPGAIDLAFDPGEIDGDIHEVVARSDGRLLIRGTFTRVQGTARAGLARLLPNGALDPSFDPGSGVGGALSSFAVQADGRILLAGTFTAVGGVARTNYARLDVDGRMDPTFEVPPVVSFTSGMARRTLALANGQSFDIGWQTRSSFSVFRHTERGEFDLVFERTEFSGSTQPVVAVQPDGRLLLGLTAVQFNGEAAVNSRLLRLNPDGGADPTFDCRGFQAPSVWVIAPLADGRIVLGGSFSSIPAMTRNRLARLKADGSFDETFGGGSGPDGSVTGITPLPDGALLVWGSFTQIDGIPRAKLALLNPDGSVNGDFDVGAGLDGAVSAAAAQADGKLVLAGSFTQVGAVTRPRLVRVFSASDGESSAPKIVASPSGHVGEATLPSGFTVNATGRLPLSYQWLRDGQAIKGATHDALALGALTDADAGAYSVVVRNELGEVTSEPARLDVVPVTPRPGRMELTYHGFPPPGVSVVSVMAATAQPDGRLLIGGSMTKVGTLNAYGALRLNVDGTLDPGFDPGIGITNASGKGRAVHAIALQPDGRILVGGEFLYYNGLLRPGLVRLLPDGSVDRGFPGPGNLTDRVQAIALQSDGRILVGGWFTGRLVRLWPDGSRDTTFTPVIGWAHVHSVAIQPDGKLVVAGDKSVQRLNPDGSVDPTFATGLTASDTIWSVALADDGGLFVGGAFGSIGGFSRQGLARLTAEGQVDPGFDAQKGASAAVMAVRGFPGNRVLAVGAFKTYAGAPPRGIALIETNGTMATDFRVGSGALRTLIVGATLECAATLPDGSLIVGGDFTLFNGLGTTGLVRLVDPVALPSLPRFTSAVTNVTLREGDRLNLHAEARGSIPMSYQWLCNGHPLPGRTSFALTLDRVGLAASGEYAVVISNAVGVVTNVVAQVSVLAPAPTRWTVDPAFAPELWQPASVAQLAIQPDGKIVAAGEFTQVNGAFRRRLARLNPDGSLDATFDPGEGANGNITALLLQPDGKMVVGGYFQRLGSARRTSVVRLNPNGTVDPTWSMTSDISPENLVLQPDGRVIVAGRFTAAAGTGMIRLNSDGSVDPGFNAGTGHLYSDAVLLADGSIWGADLFDPLIVRLHADGTFASSFPLATSEYSSILALQPDGQVLVARSGVTRWTADGAPSPGWQNLGQPVFVYCVVGQTDGTVLAGGLAYTTGTRRDPLIRLLGDGTIDSGFTPNLGNPSVSTVQVNAVAPEGPDSILVGGSFTRAGAVPVTGLVRLKADGAIDPSFTVDLKNSGAVRALARYGNTNVVVGGQFSTANGLNQPYLVVVATNGTIDTNVQLGAGPNRTVNAIEALDPATGADLAIGGAFGLANATTARGIASIAGGRLVGGTGPTTVPTPETTALHYTAQGEIILGGNFGLGRVGQSFTPSLRADPLFHSPAMDGMVRALTTTSAGTVLVGGTFTKVNSLAHPALAAFTLSSSVGSSSAIMDNNFVAVLQPGAVVNALETTPEGQVLAGGYFTNISGVACNHVVSLNPDGALDPDFSTTSGPDDEVRTLLPLPDHRVVVGGDFTTLNGTLRPHLGMLRFNGLPDDAADFGAGANGRINALLRLEDGSLIVGGEFTTFDGVPRSGVARLVPMPVLPLAPPVLADAGFVGNAFTVTVATQPGHTYQLESRETPDAGPWNALLPVTGDGTARVLVDPNPSAGPRFYRVTAR